MVEALVAVSTRKDTNLPESALGQKKDGSRRIRTFALMAFLAVGLGAGGYFWLSHRPAPGVSEQVAPKTADAGVQTEQQPPAESATLRITSEPQGANIYVDSIFKGQTPLDVALPLGKYELRLSLVNHLAWEAQIDLDNPGDMPLHIAMRPAK